jgi:hypothetical protein
MIDVNGWVTFVFLDQDAAINMDIIQIIGVVAHNIVTVQRKVTLLVLLWLNLHAQERAPLGDNWYVLHR